MAESAPADGLTVGGAETTLGEEKMVSNDRSSQDSSGAEDAALASAGAPSEEAEEAREEVSSPTPEELDAREENFARPRKPMGPTQEVAETIPDEE
jgi:hypothetical protein